MLKQLQADRLEAITKARGILDAADGEKRSLTAEERETYDKFDADLGRIDGEIDAIIEDEKRHERLAAAEARSTEPEARSVPAEQPDRSFADDQGETRGDRKSVV